MKKLPSKKILLGLFISLLLVMSFFGYQGYKNAVVAGYNTRYLIPREENQTPTIEIFKRIKKVDGLINLNEDEHIKGNSDASLVLIEYGDYECPSCFSFHPIAQELLKKYPNDLKWAFRHFPLPSLHIGAETKALAAECLAEVGGNDAFWAFTDYLYKNISQSTFSLASIAGSQGIDQEKVTSCLAKGHTKELVVEDQNTGIALGVVGTPTSVLLNTKNGNAFLVPGVVPIEDWDIIIEAISF